MRLKKIFFVVIFLSLSFFSVSIALAATNKTVENNKFKPICFTPQIPIPGFEIKANGACKAGQIAITHKGDAIALYVSALYRYAAGLAGVIAMFMIVFASWQWIMASGNAGKVDNAKDTIKGALLGLTLLFTGNLLLSNITDNLVNFQGISLSSIESQYLTLVGCPAIWEASKCVGACEWKYVRGVSESQSGFQCVDRESAVSVRTCENTALQHDCNASFNIMVEGESVVCKGLKCTANNARCSFVPANDQSFTPVLCQTNSVEACSCRVSASLQ